jgi:hypothetical protein
VFAVPAVGANIGSAITKLWKTIKIIYKNIYLYLDKSKTKI